MEGYNYYLETQHTEKKQKPKPVFSLSFDFALVCFVIFVVLILLTFL